ncbi:conserved hypothetical protein [Xenorhabdus bovienii str. kraussei Becker Underwood]|uniref:Transposase n=1 Tax=Xenorhabdus bovienii str. kraussei Becker Underwood TaxID=1398204 RepID=A0A077PX71_XENBV|nr:conserved hypothetical protein [Xenorhabdus bovienii str. kraussei Becker Underwood]
MIAQALRIHESTVNRHLKDYFSQKKLAPETAALKAICPPNKPQN